MLIMKNQDVNLLDENVQPKDPTMTSDRYVIELGSSHYDKVGNKYGITSWRYDHHKKMWLNLLQAPYHDSDSNQRGRGWAFLSKLDREIKNDFPNMKYVESSVKKNRGVRDPYAGRTIKTMIWPPTDKEKIIPTAPKFPNGVLKNFKFWAYDPKMGEAVVVTKESAYRLADTLELISFHEENIKVLNENQIRTNEQLYVDATPLFGGSEAGGTSSWWNFELISTIVIKLGEIVGPLKVYTLVIS
ncbi:hypothetical protein Hanom_Chr14g01277991 [Helianthus anomalus]